MDDDDIDAGPAAMGGNSVPPPQMTPPPTPPAQAPRQTAPQADSFRRSEATLAAQIARAAARGQRVL